MVFSDPFKELKGDPQSGNWSEERMGSLSIEDFEEVEKNSGVGLASDVLVATIGAGEALAQVRVRGRARDTGDMLDSEYFTWPTFQ